MGFEEIIGQDSIIKALKRSLQSGEINHAYLFSGPDGSGKKSLSLFFAQALNCSGPEPPCGRCLSCRKISNGNHPDLYNLQPQGSSLKIGQFREIKESLYYLPREGKVKICIINNAELMTFPASNSLLQILEDPPSDLVFILLSARPWSLLPTIISRCSHFALKPLPPDKMKLLLESRPGVTVPDGEKDLVIALAGGNPGKAFELLAQGGWEEKYNAALVLLKSIKEGSLENLFVQAEELSKSDDLAEILELFLIIYRDKLNLKLTGAPDVLIKKMLQLNNSREKDSALYGYNLFDPEETAFSLEKVCQALLQLQTELSQNVNQRLALEVLFLKMRGVV